MKSYRKKKSWHPEKFTILYSLFTTIWLKLLQTDTEISLWVWGQKNRKKTKKQLKIITKNQNKAHDRVMTLALFIFFIVCRVNQPNHGDKLVF